jgi:hypothetical protein
MHKGCTQGVLEFEKVKHCDLFYYQLVKNTSMFLSSAQRVHQ